MRVAIVRYRGEHTVVLLEGTSGPYVMTYELYQEEVRPRLVASGRPLEEEERPATEEEEQAVVEIRREIEGRR